jgi:hypothetical protein
VDLAAFGGGTAAAATPGRLEVVDARTVIRMELTTVGTISMGRIALQPSEVELVRALVAPRLGAVAGPVRCDIRVFDVLTPATAFYWDVTTNVDLLLRLPSGERAATGSATERTYSYPSEEIIGRVTAGALKQAGAQVEKALAGAR